MISKVCFIPSYTTIEDRQMTPIAVNRIGHALVCVPQHDLLDCGGQVGWFHPIETRRILLLDPRSTQKLPPSPPSHYMTLPVTRHSWSSCFAKEVHSQVPAIFDHPVVKKLTSMFEEILHSIYVCRNQLDTWCSAVLLQSFSLGQSSLQHLVDYAASGNMLGGPFAAAIDEQYSRGSAPNEFEWFPIIPLNLNLNLPKHFQSKLLFVELDRCKW